MKACHAFGTGSIPVRTAYEDKSNRFNRILKAEIEKNGNEFEMEIPVPIVKNKPTRLPGVADNDKTYVVLTTREPYSTKYTKGGIRFK